MSDLKRLRVLVEVDGESVIDVDELVLDARIDHQTPTEVIWFGSLPTSRHTGDVYLTIDYRRQPKPWDFGA